MLSSTHSPDGHRVPEKSNFAQTCNLLSQYMKQKGSLRNLNLEIGGKVESLDVIGIVIVEEITIMKLIIIDKIVLFLAIRNLVKSCLISLKPGSSFAASASSEKYFLTVIVEDDSKKASTSKGKIEMHHKNAQLTIFYSGRMLVFDDYPMGKVRELVSIAKKGSSQMSYGILSNTVAMTSGSGEELLSRPQAGNSKQAVGISSNTCQQKINYKMHSSRVEEEPPRSEANESGN